MVSLDAMDVSGDHQDDLSHHVKKRAIGGDGLPMSEEEKHGQSQNLFHK